MTPMKQEKPLRPSRRIINGGGRPSTFETFATAASADLASIEVEGPASDRTLVDEVMTTSVICVAPDLEIDALVEILSDHHISGAPVVDHTGRPLGVVSRTDLFLVNPGAPEVRGTVVRDIMMPITFSVPAGAPLSRAIALMAAEAVHRVPVVDADGKVVGIVSALDVVHWLARNERREES